VQKMAVAKNEMIAFKKKQTNFTNCWWHLLVYSKNLQSKAKIPFIGEIIRRIYATITIRSSGIRIGWHWRVRVFWHCILLCNKNNNSDPMIEVEINSDIRNQYGSKKATITVRQSIKVPELNLFSINSHSCWKY
jgi:hypothetical protein